MTPPRPSADDEPDHYPEATREFIATLRETFIDTTPRADDDKPENTARYVGKNGVRYRLGAVLPVPCPVCNSLMSFQYLSDSDGTEANGHPSADTDAGYALVCTRYPYGRHFRVVDDDDLIRVTVPLSRP